MRNPPLVVTCTPLRRTLEYGPASISTLSPATVILAATGARPGNLIVHPVVLDVAVRTYVVAVVSPLTGTERTFHLPAKSARLTEGAGGGGGGGMVMLVVVLALDEAVVSTAALSFFAQAARTAALQHIAMRVMRCGVNMEPPCEVRDERCAARAEPGERKANLRLRQEGGDCLTARPARPHFASYEPVRERDTQEPENRPSCRPQEFVDLREIPAEKPASDGENCAPDQRADQVRQKKESDIHSRYAGRDRDKSPNARQELSDRHFEEAISGEAVRRAVKILCPQQHPFSIALNPPSQTILTKREPGVVMWKRAQDGSCRLGGDHAEERHLIARRPESGERHYQLGWDRENDVLHGHEDRDSPIAQGVDEMRYPMEHGVIRASILPLTPCFSAVANCCGRLSARRGARW